MIDPLTSADAFATMVSLYGLFRSERSNTSKDTIDDYLEWLARHRHDNLVEEIRHNILLSNAITKLLTGQHADIVQQLSELQTIMAGIASRMPVFQPMTSALNVKMPLSDQAMSILRQIESSKADGFMAISSLGGPMFQLFGDFGRGEQLVISEPRFLQADLEKLCAYGLLMEREMTNYTQFRITREGAAIAR